MPHLFCFGLGFSALALIDRLRPEGWTFAGTCRADAKCREMATRGIAAHPFDGTAPLDPAALVGATHILISTPPGRDGDPVLRHHADHLRGLKPGWIGYLSTTGVYGDTGGRMVTEDSPLNPSSARSRQRVEAEAGWLDLWRDGGLPVHLFRLAGIYGPGRSALDQARAGAARRIDRPDHRFSRIHVADIANVLAAAIARPNPGTVYNVCDDEPAPAADVTAEACRLLGIAPPPLVPFEEAAKEMSEMALSFWRDNRLVSNARMKRDLGVALLYPTYREGLAAILAAGG